MPAPLSVNDRVFSDGSIERPPADVNSRVNLYTNQQPEDIRDNLVFNGSRVFSDGSIERPPADVNSRVNLYTNQQPEDIRDNLVFNGSFIDSTIQPTFDLNLSNIIAYTPIKISSDSNQELLRIETGKIFIHDLEISIEELERMANIVKSQIQEENSALNVSDLLKNRLERIG